MERKNWSLNRIMIHMLSCAVLFTLFFIIYNEYCLGNPIATFFLQPEAMNRSLTIPNSSVLGTDEKIEKKVEICPTNKTFGIPKSFYSPDDDFLSNLTEPRPMLNITMVPWKVRPEYTSNISRTGEGIQWTMIALIKSAANHFGRRSSVRNTWGTKKLYKGVRLEFVFLIGKSMENETEQKLMEENHQHGDILQMNIPELYKNLAYKIETGMRWASQNFPPSWLCIDTDDDVFPNLPKIYQVIKTMKDQERERYKKLNGQNVKFTEEELMENLPFYCGFEFTIGARPRRNQKNKFYMSPKDFAATEFPPYCQGGWFTLPVKLAGYLTEITKCLPVWWVEDIWLSGYARLIHYTTLGSNVTLNWGKPEVGMWTNQRGGLAYHFQEVEKSFVKTYENLFG